MLPLVVFGTSCTHLSSRENSQKTGAEADPPPRRTQEGPWYLMEQQPSAARQKTLSANPKNYLLITHLSAYSPLEVHFCLQYQSRLWQLVLLQREDLVPSLVF